MPDSFADSLREWHNFYFMAGGAAATLIGLLFVAISLGAHLVSPERKADIDTFVTPILFYFISVLVLSFIMLVPASPIQLPDEAGALSLASTGPAGGMLALAGMLGLGRVSGVMRQMVEARQRAPVEHDHWIWHAILPGLSYALILGTGLWLVLWGAPAPLAGPALGTALLLISGIWRAWDLVLWIVYQRVR